MQTNERVKAHKRRLQFFATDFVNFFASFVDQFPEPLLVTLSDFKHVFDKHQIEYLHYCGTCDMSIPYHSIIIEELLQLAAAYLYIPAGIAKAHVRPFALLLIYFLFATQPGLSIELKEKNMYGTVTQIRIARGVMEELLDALSDTITTSSNSNSNSAIYNRVMFIQSEHNNNNNDKTHILSKAECIAIVALNKYDGWSIQPYEDVSEYMAAIIEAHDAHKIPLLKMNTSTSVARHITSLPDYIHSSPRALPTERSAETSTLLESNEFRNELSLYEQMKRDAGM